MLSNPGFIDHFINPRNTGELENPDLIAVVGNPHCGDELHFYARVANNRISECTFLAYGCPSLLATASILTMAIRGRTIAQLAIFDENQLLDLLGDITPSQRRCAVLVLEIIRALVSKHQRNALRFN